MTDSSAKESLKGLFPLIIDSHVHVWDPKPREYEWMVGPYAPIRRQYQLSDLKPSLDVTGVERVILVQTHSSLAETRSFIQLAKEFSIVAGVVGWIDLLSDGFSSTLQELLESPGGSRLVALRHQVHDEPDPNWLLQDKVQRAIAEMGRRDISFDLLVRPRELRAALATVASHPTVNFIVDHIAKPAIAAREFEAWSNELEGFRNHRSHVWCKISGMVTEADWTRWSTDDLSPYVARVLEMFGPDRVMLGSDWPVCTLAGTYERVMKSYLALVSHLDLPQRIAVARDNAIEAYRLSRGDAQTPSRISTAGKRL